MVILLRKFGSFPMCYLRVALFLVPIFFKKSFFIFISKRSFTKHCTVCMISYSWFYLLESPLLAVLEYHSTLPRSCCCCFCCWCCCCFCGCCSCCWWMEFLMASEHPKFFFLQTQLLKAAKKSWPLVFS